MKLFQNLDSIRDEIQQMEKDEKKRREDRATVSAFFNGKPPYSQKEADAMGLRVNVNNLFGYTDLAASKDQMVALYTKPPRLFSVELDWAPVSEKRRWEQVVTRAFNRALKKNDRLKMPYEGISGDATMHGEGEFYFADPYDPIPRHLPLSKRLVPTGASTDPKELTHFGICTEIGVAELARHARNQDEGWNQGNISALLKVMHNKEKADGKAPAQDALAPIDSMNPEELELARQERADYDRVWRLKVPVYYFYQIDDSQDNPPVCLTIMARNFRDGGEAQGGKDLVLFEQDNYFPCIGEAIHPFFMDCILGGAPKWHRVKGQGHLNYSISWHLEVLMCRLMQGAGETATNIWTVGDAANREELEKFIMRHNGIVPENVSLVTGRQTMDFMGVISVVNMFRDAANKNNRTGQSNSGQTQTDELQVQALFRQGQINAQASSRVSNWYSAFEGYGAKSLGRFASTEIDRTDRCYSMVLDFQSEIQRHGVPLHAVQSHNVNVTAYKITGDGDEQKALRAASFFMQNMAMYPPESQTKLKRIVTGIVADDYELAEDLIPFDDKPDPDQVREAEGENNTAIIQGRPPMIAATDVDELHLQTHFAGLGGLLKEHAALNQQAFTPKGLLAFKALGAHAVAHIQRLEAMGKKDVAKRAMETMGNLARLGDKLAHNLQQQQGEQQQEPVDPVEQAKLEMQAASLKLAEEKHAFAVQKFQRVQSAKEQNASIDQSLKLGKDARDTQKHHQDLAARDVELALQVGADRREANQPVPASK